MKRHARLSAALIAATLPIAGGLSYLAWAPWSAREARQRLGDGIRFSRELDSRLARVQSISAAKNDLAAAVVVGRLSLFEAAAEYRALDQGNPDFSWEVFRYLYLGGSDDERFCRMVLVYVEGALMHRPASEAGPIFSHLESELEEHLRTHGTVVLPPVVSTQ